MHPLIALFGVLLACLSFASGYYFANQKTVPLTSSPPPPAIQEKAEKIIEYQDIGLGFSVKYPIDYELSQQSGVMYPPTSGINISSGTKLISIAVQPANQSIDKNDGRLLFNYILRQNKYQGLLAEADKIENVTLKSGQKMYFVKSKSFTSNYTPNQGVYAVIGNYGNLYTISLYHDPLEEHQLADPSYLEYLDIIHSFKLIP